MSMGLKPLAAASQANDLISFDSGASKKFMEAHSLRLGNPHRRINRNVFLPALHPADIHGRQAGLFRQAFLGKIGLSPPGADCFAENSPVLRNSVQSSLSKQQAWGVSI